MQPKTNSLNMDVFVTRERSLKLRAGPETRAFILYDVIYIVILMFYYSDVLCLSFQVLCVSFSPDPGLREFLSHSGYRLHAPTAWFLGGRLGALQPARGTSRALECHYIRGIIQSLQQVPYTHWNNAVFWGKDYKI